MLVVCAALIVTVNWLVAPTVSAKTAGWLWELAIIESTLRYEPAS